MGENNLTQNADGYICSDCGADVSDDDKICPKCGADLTILEEADDEGITNDINKKIIRNSSSDRHYKTAYSLAKVIEFISWFIIVVGIIAGIAIASDSRNPTIGVIICLISLVFGLLLVFSAQLTLIFIDTENNTRKTASELEKIRVFLSDMPKTFNSNTNS